MTTKRAVLISAGIMVIVAFLLHLAGRIWVSASGQIILWVGGVGSPEDSQQLSDWYSASHFIHGILFFGFLYLFRRYLSVGSRFIIAVLIESGWELLENSPLIIDRYRAATIAIGYTGDSILNSISDITFMALGFVFARYVPVWVAVVMVICLEVLAGYVIHDNLLLNIIMLVYPMDAIRAWQGRL
jgi:Protein of unknown function (DUF2585)